MLSITLNPESLTPSQRKYVADLIINFPASDDLSETPALTGFTAYQDPEEEDEHTESPEVAFAHSNVIPITPAAPAAPAAFAASESVPLDKAGLPWDVRIHTGSRATNADGSWRRKRGVEEAEVNRVEGELRQLMGITTIHVPSDEARMLPMQNASLVPAPPPLAAVPAPPPPPPASAPPSADPYIDLITRASELIGAKVITMDQVDATITAAGGVSLPLMKNVPHLIPTVLASINAMAGAA